MQNSKSQPSTQPIQIPTQVLSSLKLFQNSIKPQTIRKNQQDLPKWFIDNILNYKDPHLPRLQLLSRAQSIIKNNLTNQKYINGLFLQQDAIVGLVHYCQNFIDIAFILNKHLKLKVNLKTIQYADNILTTVKSRVQYLLKEYQNKLQYLFCVEQVQSYLQSKRNLPQALYIVDVYERQQMQDQAILIFKYIFKPIFQRKNLIPVYQYLYPIIYWFIVINNDEIPQRSDKQFIIIQMSKKVDSFLWVKKNTSNIIFMKTFNKILDLLSVKCLQQDSFTPFTLAPLLLKLKFNVSDFQDLITNWVATQDAKKLPKMIQNIFRNSLNSGCTVFCFHIIKYFSDYMTRYKNFDTLYHLFNSFIRKQYLSLKLPSASFVKHYVDTLLFYAIGFINRDRLDGQTQLDRLAINLSEMVCKKNFSYDDSYTQIILFFRIYQNRFQFLSNTSKRFVKSLEDIYKYRLQIATIHQQVGKRMFKQYSADYDQNQIYSLQKSHRYAGLVNLGNTCYMNSFMQALYMTKKFKTIVIKADDEGIAPTNHPIFKSLVQLFTELNSKIIEQKTQVNPSFFKQKVPEPFKSSYQQHDSSQFGRMYLDSVTSQLKDTVLADKMDRLFIHQLMTKLICKNCQNQKTRKQKTFDFILNVDQSSPQAITISDLLRKYFKGYELDQQNKIRCENCRKNSSALVINEPVQLAQHLIATVSIFKYDKQRSSKIIRPLNFQFSLNFKNILPKIVTDDQIYQLYAFILHIGTGVERGHYQCFARNLQQNPMLWYKFDDHYVTQQQINTIQDFHFGQVQTPYVLFYSSSKSKKIFASPKKN